MEKQKCPECKASKYTNPSLKMMVNACGHALCENCVDILFSRGSGACPQCKTPLRRGQFRFQMFEDSQVEKELDIRKRLMKDLNLSEDNFPSLQEYNDYLEFVESAVFSLTNELDVEATKRRLEEFKKAHADAIKSNRLRRRPELAALDGFIEAESGGYVGGGGDSAVSAADAAAAAAAETTATTNNGINGSSINSGGGHKSSTGAAESASAALLDPAAVAELVKPTRLQLNGPPLPPDEAPAPLAGILAGRLPADYAAGGYAPRMAVERLLADAFCDLYYRL